MGKVIILREYKDKKLEDATRLQTDDGKEFVIYPPDLWDPELQKIAANDETQENIAALLLNGKDKVQEFTESGGSILTLIVIFGEELGIDLGKSLASLQS